MKPTTATKLFLSPPHMNGEELQLIIEAFSSNYIAPLGAMVDAFEKEFAACVGIPYCLALTSGTAAMHLAMRELGVGPEDEVLASTLTFIGSVNSAAYLGANLTFIDSDTRSWNMDPDLLAEEIASCAKKGKLPKIVVPTDLYGQCADLNRIKAVCDRYEVPVLSDCAEAMGARYRSSDVPAHPSCDLRPTAPSPHLSPVGPQPSPADAKWLHSGAGAAAAIYSFNGNKIITTSGGGMLASEDKDLIDHARKLSQQARDPAPHYEHTEIGYNYRMSNILAAIGRGQLRVLDDRVQRKRQIFDSYRHLLRDLPGIHFMPEAEYGRSNRWLTVIVIDQRESGTTKEQVRLALEAENIESRPIWKPMHMQPVFRGCRFRGGAVSEHLFRHGLCVPSGTAMTQSDIERVAAIIRSCCRAGVPARR
jgi:dTDP-4-amino-4,6-dideoxygalactose transaminase